MCLDCPTTYCPASVLQARPSHECVLLLLRRPSIGAHTLRGKLQEQYKSKLATYMYGGVLLRPSGLVRSGAA